MELRIASLRDGTNHIEEHLESAAIDLDTSVFKTPVCISVDAEKRTGKIYITVRVRAVGDFLCDRCGDEFALNVDGECSVVFIQRESILPDEMPGDEVRSFLPGQDKIDLSVECHDALLLSVPMKMLCREDCRGLCPRCGKNLNQGKCRCEIEQSASVDLSSH